MNRDELETLLTEGLRVEVDPLLTEHGFNRRANSLRYSRTRDLAFQRVSFGFDMKPSYQPGADAHLLPGLTVIMEGLMLFFPGCSADILRVQR